MNPLPPFSALQAGDLVEGGGKLVRGAGLGFPATVARVEGTERLGECALQSGPHGQGRPPGPVALLLDAGTATLTRYSRSATDDVSLLCRLPWKC